MLVAGGGNGSVTAAKAEFMSVVRDMIISQITVYMHSIAKCEGRSSGCQMLNSMYTKTLKFYLLDDERLKKWIKIVQI